MVKPSHLKGTVFAERAFEEEIKAMRSEGQTPNPVAPMSSPEGKETPAIDARGEAAPGAG